jgi:hypothetical protein
VSVSLPSSLLKIIQVRFLSYGLYDRTNSSFKKVFVVRNIEGQLQPVEGKKIPKKMLTFSKKISFVKPPFNLWWLINMKWAISRKAKLCFRLRLDDSTFRSNIYTISSQAFVYRLGRSRFFSPINSFQTCKEDLE